jgi:hypothetical protein
MPLDIEVILNVKVHPRIPDWKGYEMDRYFTQAWFAPHAVRGGGV